MIHYYKQCFLQKDNVFKTAWIPEKFAHIGHTIRIKDDDGWIVRGVGTRAPEQIVAELERDHLHQRKASDI